MINIKDKKLCSGCTACYNCCPENAISMNEDNEGFLYPTIDNHKCTNCRKCERICPYLNISPKKQEEELSLCYAGYNTNEQIRSLSSSGGIFALAAKYVLERGGIVFGAAFDKAFDVSHMSAETKEELIKLIGSKYAQSRIGDIYKEVKKQLLVGKPVLFSGTTCQVAGLKAYLEKPYQDLICIDFICLGIPSPKVWRDYLITYFKDYDIEHINFKDKTNGWHTFTLRITGKNKKYAKIGRNTEFFAGYFKGLYSRPSCSQCMFKKDERVSDMTIADCWGYINIAPELDDNKGLSSIIVHSTVGVKLFENIKNELVYKEIQLSDIKKYNDNYCSAKPMGDKREQFWLDYGELPMKKLFKKYCRIEKENQFVTLSKKAYHRMKKIVGR